MQIRKATIHDWKEIAHVHVDCMRSAYRNVFPSETIEKITYSDRERRWQNDLPKTIQGGTMNFVAVNKQEKIVGFSLGGTMRDARLRIGYTGELYGLYVHPHAQGQSLGLKLFESVAHHLVSLHHSSMALWTFQHHDSCSFFHHLNGKEVYKKNTTIGGKDLEEIAFGWDNIATLSQHRDNLN
ncbi:N-acetyltransferase family protein [Evansella sp. AB-rgal1]|uniref:GNAT family N-acetyltransferase n=1 Tax=Evansella sp. AB-rgal1 TaxID=3242696 RepID=UPI00359D95FC